MDAATLEVWDRQLRDLTGAQAVALAFVERPPEGIERRPQAQAAGCGFWKLAAAGNSFFTDAADHTACAVGAYTHGVELSPAGMQDLSSLVGTMVGLEYISESEVPSIPRRAAPLRYVIYAPLARSPVAPDVVLVRGNARQLMLLAEAGRAAGHMESSSSMGRPACAMVPHSMTSGAVILSLGCVGNRVYTALGDNEGYVAVPGQSLATTMAKLEAILAANKTLESFHRERLASTPASA